MTLIHPTAIIEKGATIGQNVKIGPFCIVGRSVTLCDDVELKSHVIIENKVTIGSGTAIHSFAVIGGNSQIKNYSDGDAEVIIGKNNVIREYATINIGTELEEMKTVVGDNCFIMTSAHIAHDCILGNNIIMANGATLGGRVKVEDYAYFGGKTAVHQRVRIGKHAMIGGMSGVERDLVPFALVTGGREKTIRLNIVGLKRSGFSVNDIHILRKVYGILFESSVRSIGSAIRQIEEEGLSNNKHVAYLLNFLNGETVRGLCGAEYICCNEEERV